MEDHFKDYLAQEGTDRHRQGGAKPVREASEENHPNMMAQLKPHADRRSSNKIRVKPLEMAKLKTQPSSRALAAAKEGQS